MKRLRETLRLRLGANENRDSEDNPAKAQHERAFPVKRKRSAI